MRRWEFAGQVVARRAEVLLRRRDRGAQTDRLISFIWAAMILVAAVSIVA
jgi:hypothetical protein